MYLNPLVNSNLNLNISCYCDNGSGLSLMNGNDDYDDPVLLSACQITSHKPLLESLRTILLNFNRQGDIRVVREDLWKPHPMNTE